MISSNQLSLLHEFQLTWSIEGEMFLDEVLVWDNQY